MGRGLHPEVWHVTASGRPAPAAALVLAAVLVAAGCGQSSASEPAGSTPSAGSAGPVASNAGASVAASAAANTSAASATATAGPTIVHGVFSPTGSLAQGRSQAVAVVLADARVLVVGGYAAGSNATSSAEVYDPATGRFSVTGSMAVARVGHQATLLDDGRVLVTGGRVGGVAKGYASAELYDPATGKFTATGSMKSARIYHSATLLPDGRVLVAGGESGSCWNTAEIYDPATGKFTATGSMRACRYSHSALLVGGVVLLIGGENGGTVPVATAEIYDPATGKFAATGSMGVRRGGNKTATLLANGNVLVAGGSTGDSSASITAAAELYDPTTGTFTSVGSMTGPRAMHAAVLLGDGRVLICGGKNAFTSAGNLATAELYDPATGKFTATGSLAEKRNGLAAVLLKSGKVLLVGGSSGSALLAGAELYQP